MLEDEDMQEQEAEQELELRQLDQDAIKFGEAKLATEDARAAAIAKGNVEVHDADTLELPEVRSYSISYIKLTQTQRMPEYLKKLRNRQSEIRF